LCGSKPSIPGYQICMQVVTINGSGINFCQLNSGLALTRHALQFNRICKRSDGKLWLLGEGSYGKVWKAVWTKPDGTDVDVAMKMTIISPGGHHRHTHAPAAAGIDELPGLSTMQ
jgi:hypothetical protein